MSEFQIDDSTKVVTKTKIYLEITEDKTREIIADSIIQQVCTGAPYEIFYSGRFLNLCRTGYKDDVATYPGGIFDCSAEDVRAYYLAKVCRFGARVSEQSFAVIDSE